MARLRLEGVAKRFGGVTALAGIDLDVAPGEFMVLWGPSGCGKSTLLRLVAGLETVSEGRILIGERRVEEVAARDRDVAMVFQRPALYPHKTVRANLEFPLKARRVDRVTRSTRALEVAEILGLTSLLDRRPDVLSGGERQRVALGKAMMRRPEVFVLDEPLSHLDAARRAEARSELIELHRRLGATFLYVTHDQTEAMTMGTRIAVMSPGRIEQVGTPREVYDRPANVVVAGFVGTPAMNLLSPGRFDTSGHRVGIRPEYLRLDASGPIEMTVTRIEHLGHEVLVTGVIDAGETLVMRQATRADLVTGDRVRVAWDRDRLHHFDTESGRRITAVTTDEVSV